MPARNEEKESSFDAFGGLFELLLVRWRLDGQQEAAYFFERRVYKACKILSQTSAFPPGR